MFRWCRRRDDEAGAVLVVVCIAMVAMIGATGLAIDVGRVTVNNRTLQAGADVIALDAGRALNGQTAAQLSGSSGAVVLAVQSSATRNKVPFANLTVDLGTMTGTTFTTIATPVINGAIQTVTSATVPKAVRVSAGGSVAFLFDMASPHTVKQTTRSAIASMDNYGGFSIGSWLASISGSTNSILGSLFGDAFHLNVVSYSGLVNGNVTLQALGLNMPASVGVLSPTQLLNTSISVNNFMLAAISALNAQGNTTAANLLNSMILNASATGTVKLGDFINVAAGAENAAASASLNVLQLLTASAMVMEKNGGHALSIPTTTISIPGVTSITASATVIEPPQYYFGPVGGSVSTAQVRLSINPVINLSLGVPAVLAVAINGALPLDLTAAGATGTLSAVNCATPGITVGSVTQAVNLNTSVSLGLDVTALFLHLGLAQLNLAAGAKTTANPYSTTFSYPGEFGPSQAKSVGSSTLGLSGLLNISSANISLLGLGVSLTAVANLVVPAINGILGNLDSLLTLPLVQALGVKFGGADIAALGYTCNGLRLAG